MNNIYKHVLVASLLMVGGTAMAQTLNSAYFTEDYKFRHDMNPAFENKQNYISIPALGNINVNLQGNFGYQDVVMHNPMYGQEAGAKKMTTFMNPYISTSDALSGFSKGQNRIAGDVGIALLSAGFKGFGSYNTIEVNAKASFGASSPISRRLLIIRILIIRDLMAYRVSMSTSTTWMSMEQDWEASVWDWISAPNTRLRKT